MKFTTITAIFVFFVLLIYTFLRIQKEEKKKIRKEKEKKKILEEEAIANLTHENTLGNC